MESQCAALVPPGRGGHGRAQLRVFIGAGGRRSSGRTGMVLGGVNRPHAGTRRHFDTLSNGAMEQPFTNRIQKIIAKRPFHYVLSVHLFWAEDR